MASGYQPSVTLPTDIEMNDGNGNIGFASSAVSNMQSKNYTPDDLLLEDERKAFQSDSFQFGQVPIHAPSRNYSWYFSNVKQHIFLWPLDGEFFK